VARQDAQATQRTRLEVVLGRPLRRQPQLAHATTARGAIRHATLLPGRANPMAGRAAAAAQAQILTDNHAAAQSPATDVSASASCPV
jgi:hypothetical protein